MKLAQKLSDIQKKLNAPKNQFNKFGGYKYRSCEDILMAVKPLLGELAITINDEIILVSDRIYVKSTATITDGTESISASAFAREAADKKGMDAAQVTGSTSSYARKYALNGLLLIDDNKDADHDGNHQEQSGQKLTKEQVAQVQSALDGAGLSAIDICKVAKVNSLVDIQQERFDNLMKWISKNAQGV